VTALADRFISAGGIRTHFLEAGSGPDVVLLHSGEFGACAQLSWERVIPALARHFRVVAPDFVGYGKSEKLFSFENMWDFRIRQVTDFLHALSISRAHFIGNSLGATMLLAVAAMDNVPWPLDRIVASGGGGTPPDNEARRTLIGYDGTPAAMQRALDVLLNDQSLRASPEYLKRRQEEALRPGAWECAAAARFRAPWRTNSDMPAKPDYGRIRVPTLLITGAQDRVRGMNFGRELQAEIPNSQLRTIPDAGHCPNIDTPDAFTEIVLAFLA
jgi:2-hydroxymuconate-semialdehyde hydrolase